jgi:hypothetical protein
MRYRECVDGMAVNELITTGAIDPASVPPGRIMIDVTSRADIRLGARLLSIVADRVVDGAVLSFELPPPPQMGPLTKLDFLRLLTPAEVVAFVTGAVTDPTLTYAKAMLDATLTISADDPIFVQMLTYSVTQGVLTQERATMIVAQLKGSLPRVTPDSVTVSAGSSPRSTRMPTRSKSRRDGKRR